MFLHTPVKISVSVGLLLSMAACLCSCSRKKERLVQETVAQRVAEFRKKETAKCRAALLADAEHIVDSLLLYEALSDVQDSLKQLRPFKPVPPAIIAPIDSLKIKPIFEQ